MNRAFAIALLASAVTVHGQWESVGGGVMVGSVGDVAYDSAAQRLYISGQFHTVYQDTALDVSGLACWYDGIWHTVNSDSSNPFSSPGAIVSKIALYHDALVIVGSFDSVNHVAGTQRCAQWKDGAWQPLGDISGIDASPVWTAVIDDTLHVVGSFDMVGTEVIHRIALWDGENWHPAGNNYEFESILEPSAKFQGELYVGGNFEELNGVNDLARYRDGEWQELGPGILGDPWVRDLEVYDDLLWVAGNFFAAAGNVANGLMAWDGQQWLNPFPQISFTSQARDVTVINNKLYFSGPFNVVGLTGEYRIGEYDGNTLCIIGGPGIYATRLAGSADTLYAATCVADWCAINGMEPHGIMKWPLDAPPDTCFSIVQGLTNEEAQGSPLAVYPNPAGDQLMFTLPRSLLGGPSVVRIYSSLGQLALSTTIDAVNASVEIGHLRSGHYHGSVIQDKSRYPFRFVKH